MARTVDNREEHQPARTPPSRKQPGDDELVAACGQTVALILAYDMGTTPLKVAFDDPEKAPVVCEQKGLLGPRQVARPLQRYEDRPLVAHAVSCAARSKVAAVRVLVPGGAQARRSVEAAARKGLPRSKSAPELSFAIYDREHDIQTTLEACGFALYDITKGILDYALELLGDYEGADSVLVMACDQVRITPSHIFELCSLLRSDPGLDLVASWIMWLRRLPMVISRRFLEGLDASGYTVPGPNGIDRPLPSISMRDVVFGEEKLAANVVVPARLESFLKYRTLSAREAVRIARSETAAGKPDSVPDSQPNTEGEKEAKGTIAEGAITKGAKESKSAPQQPESRSEADREMLEVARSVIERLSAWRDGLDSSRRKALDRADAWARRNVQDFPLLNDRSHKDTLAYLDSAATTQRCARALQAQSDFDQHENANVYRGGYDLSMQATFTLNDARKTLEDFIGADRRQTVFTMNASAGCNLVAQAWGDRNVNEGDVIVVPLSEHHSNLMPWMLLARRRGARLEYIPLLADGRLDLDKYEELLGLHPKLVCVAHISNVLGLVNPVERMTAAAHEAGARVMVDAAQSIPHLPLDVKTLGADFLAFSAHKMYGPLGIGGVWISPAAFDEMDPVAIGGGTISHVSTDSYYLRPGAIQYEVGTPPISQAIGWAAAVEYIEALGMEAIGSHGRAMVAMTVEALHAIEGVTVWGDHSGDDGAGGLMSFSLAGVGPTELGNFCGRLGVAIRSGGHCALPIAANMGVTGTGRASFGVHTTCEDIEALGVAVELCRRMYQ